MRWRSRSRNWSRVVGIGNDCSKVGRPKAGTAQNSIRVRREAGGPATSRRLPFVPEAHTIDYEWAPACLASASVRGSPVHNLYSLGRIQCVTGVSTEDMKLNT